jgi:hypothetical protein
MHLVTRPNILVESSNLLVIVHISINYCTYIYVICKRSTAILWAIHTLPKEFNRIWFHIVILRPLQHAKILGYNDISEGIYRARQTWDIR